MTGAQILALDAALVRLIEDEPDPKRKYYLQIARQRLVAKDESMALVSMIAGGVPADQARAIFALVNG